jgi:hypothetical protein
MIIMLADHFYRVQLAIVATAVLVCVFSIYGAMAGQRDRTTPLTMTITSTSAVVAESDCVDRGWPYYDAHCMRNMRLQQGRRVPTRIIAPGE